MVERPAPVRKTQRLMSIVKIGMVALMIAATLLGTDCSPQAMAVNGKAPLKNATSSSGRNFARGGRDRRFALRTIQRKMEPTVRRMSATHTGGIVVPAILISRNEMPQTADSNRSWMRSEAAMNGIESEKDPPEESYSVQGYTKYAAVRRRKINDMTIWKRAASLAVISGVGVAAWLMGQPMADPLLEGFRTVEAASVADAMEQLYGQQSYMKHDMRPVFPTKFAGPAVTVLLKKAEHNEGSAASQGMLDAIDAAKPGSVYVMVLEDGLDYAGMGGLMATAMKYRGFTGAIIDASVRDTPQIRKLQFPIFSRGVAPSTTINHYKFAGVNIPVTCAGAKVNAGDIIVADEDGVAVVPKAKAAEVLKKAQELDDTEHRMIPFIEKFKSIKEAVAKFGRI
jgi:4-hydroxy-4-methyl-2-oxoglutarate aldolase